MSRDQFDFFVIRGRNNHFCGLTRLARGLNRLTCVTHQIRWDPKLRDWPIAPLRCKVTWNVKNSYKLCSRYGISWWLFGFFLLLFWLEILTAKLAENIESISASSFKIWAKIEPTRAIFGASHFVDEFAWGAVDIFTFPSLIVNWTFSGEEGKAVDVSAGIFGQKLTDAFS